MFKVGDMVIRKSTGMAGFVHDTRATRNPMIAVSWDEGGGAWLPEEEFREWHPSDPVPGFLPNRIGRTTPAYLIELRRKHPWKKDPAKETKAAQNRLADDLAGLSDRRKKHSKNKAKKLIAWFTGLPES